ncbi:MAG TPA: nuclear transport factor 2 family protein [Chitinophagaceae bacterium]|nr:nuclear transport factor 2 family protein [Chitinophagaceae bacterium]
MGKPATVLFVLFLLIAKSSFGQVDSIGLKNAMQQLDKALLQKDETVLKLVLHKDVSYGHSNGWIQSKTDILNDLTSGKLTYNKIANNSSSIITISKKYATVKTNTNAEGIVNETAFNLKLHIMQFWIKTKKGWQLIARQSAKLS